MDRDAQEGDGSGAGVDPRFIHKCALAGCEKTFVRLRGRQKYCTRAHYWLAKKIAQRGAPACRQCKKPFTSWRTKFCGRDCKNAWIRENAPRKKCKLPTCNEPRARGRGGFCSAKCRHERRRQLTAHKLKTPLEALDREARDAKCAECGGPVPISRARRAIGRGWRFFCTDDHCKKFHRRESHRRENERHPPRVFCLVCEEKIGKAWRAKHPVSTVCSRTCARARRVIQSRIAADKIRRRKQRRP